MLREIDRLVEARRTFAFETTLNGRAYIPKIRRWRELGFEVELYFLQLPSFGMAIDRVAHRVAHGGHHIPPAVVERRFVAGKRNFEVCKTVVDGWHHLDNSVKPFKVIDRSHEK